MKKSYGEFKQALDTVWKYTKNDNTLEDWLMTLTEGQRDKLYGHPLVMREDLLP